MPFFKNSENWTLKNLVGNWMYSGSYIYESPEYATVQSGLDSNLNGDSAGDRAIVNPAGIRHTGTGVTALTSRSGQVVAYLANDPTARYIATGLGSFGNAGRNTLPCHPDQRFRYGGGQEVLDRRIRESSIRGFCFQRLQSPSVCAGPAEQHQSDLADQYARLPGSGNPHL